MFRIFFLITVFLVSSCSQTDNDTIALEYTVTATPITKTDSAGEECVTAEGNVLLKSTKVSGTIIDMHKRIFNIFGLVDDLGQVSGGFAMTSANVAKFQGKFDSSGGQGTWQDIFQCSGNWVAVKI